MIAMALSCDPQVLIADEPTTALDVTIQAQILDLMLELKEKLGTAIVLITHDLGVVAETGAARHRHVCRPQGRGGDASRSCSPGPLHPYTRGLMRAIPRLDLDAEEAGRRPRLAGDPRHRPGADAGRSPAAPSRRAAPLRASSLPREAAAAVRAGAGHVAACWEADRVREAARMSAAPSLEVESLVKHFPIGGGLLQRRQRAWCGPSTASASPSARGETLGVGRRIRLRQVHRRQGWC